MARHANTTVNETKQARTCAALMNAFCDADDAYAAAVERGDTDREAVMAARSEALVAFLTGPRPINEAEAYQVIFAAMQAVVDGNDFDIAWRASVGPSLSLLGVRGAKDLLVSEAKTETLHRVRDDLDTLSTKLDSLEDLARFLAMEVQGGGHAETAGSFFSIMNLVESLKDEALELVGRLMAIERVERAGGEVRP